MFASRPSDDFKCPVKEELTITSGKWEVLANHGAKVKHWTVTNLSGQEYKKYSDKRVVVIYPVFLALLVVALLQSSDLGGWGDEAGLFPGNQRLSSGAPSLRGELRLAGWNGPTHQTWVLPQLLREPGIETHTHVYEWTFSSIYSHNKLLEIYTAYLKCASIPWVERCWYWQQQLKLHMDTAFTKTCVSESVVEVFNLCLSSLAHRPSTCSSAITAAWPRRPVCTSSSCSAPTATRSTKSRSSGRAWWSPLVPHWLFMTDEILSLKAELWVKQNPFVCFQVSHWTTRLQRSSASQGSRASSCTACCTNPRTWSPAGGTPPSSLFMAVRRFDLFYFNVRFMLWRYKMQNNEGFTSLLNLCDFYYIIWNRF